MRWPWYVEASLWRGDECTARWTTEVPGKTGPRGMQWWRMIGSWRIRLRRRRRA